MTWPSRHPRQRPPAHGRAPWTYQRMLTNGFPFMALMFLIVAVACSPNRPPSSSGISAPAPTASSPRALDPLSRIHHASPNNVPLFARVQFTPSTTYEQAVVILGSEPYPWECDEPWLPAPPLDERRAAFAVSHTLLISYPRWDQLERIAASPQVVSVDGTPLYPCP